MVDMAVRVDGEVVVASRAIYNTSAALKKSLSHGGIIDSTCGIVDI